jgi:hypothetical protein
MKRPRFRMTLVAILVLLGVFFMAIGPSVQTGVISIILIVYIALLRGRAW